LSIAGNPKGKHAGGLSFGTFALAIKEKILAHEGRNFLRCACTINKNENTKFSPLEN